METNFLDSISKDLIVLKHCQFKDIFDSKYSNAAIVRSIDSLAYYVAYKYPSMDKINIQYCGVDFFSAYQKFIETIL